MNSPIEPEGGVVVLSVYTEAEKAQDDFKWLESEKAGRDLGDEAREQWTRRHWLRFYRWLFVQHVRGEQRFREFHPQTFGVVHREFPADPQLLDDVLNMICDGAENLPLIWWAWDRPHLMSQLIEILNALDINSQRLAPPMHPARTGCN